MIRLCEGCAAYSRKWKSIHMDPIYISNLIQQIHRELIHEGIQHLYLNKFIYLRFVIEYEFSSRFVDVHKLLDNQPGVVHLRGSECDIRVESNRETTHYISSPTVCYEFISNDSLSFVQYPNMYPENTTCIYIIDGLQGAQNLERVLLTFETFAVLSEAAL